MDIPPIDYDLAVQDSSGTTTISEYDADLSPYIGQAITILMSGFLNPLDNNNGPEFGLWVSIASGGNLIPLTSFTGINKIDSRNELSLYPNPVKEKIKLISDSKNASYKIFNIAGKVVQSDHLQKSPEQNILVENLASGIYFFQIDFGDRLLIKRFIKL